jgi:hypothetical protein
VVIEPVPVTTVVSPGLTASVGGKELHEGTTVADPPKTEASGSGESGGSYDPPLGSVLLGEGADIEPYLTYTVADGQARITAYSKNGPQYVSIPDTLGGYPVTSIGNFAIQMIEKAGLFQYEISNFARPGYECQHNLGYWKANEYLGIGPGAVSFQGNRRYINKKNLLEYLGCLEKDQEPETEELEFMDAQELAADAIILGLRLCTGIKLKDLVQTYGINELNYYKELINLSHRKLIRCVHPRHVLMHGQAP